jgi:TP901-1 family phage major tail protein
MTAFTGRDVVVEFAIAKEDALPASLVYQRLGMMRGKEMKTSWDTADTTADMSPSFTKTSLVTFKAVEFSGDGVTYTEAAFNQQAFKVQAVSPSAATDNQPKVWLRMTDLSGAVWEGPFIVTEWSDSASYSDAVTWSISASSNGNVTYTPA